MGGSASRWKRQEREVARAMGTEREPNDGHLHGDAVTDRFSMEVKTTKALPKWLWAALMQADIAASTNGTRIPVVVLSEVRRGRKARRLVVLHWDHWMDLHGPMAPEEDA